MIKDLDRFKDYSNIYREYIPLVGYMYSRNPKLTYTEDPGDFVVDIEQRRVIESFGVTLSINSFKSNTLLIVEEGVPVAKAVDQFNSLEGGNMAPTHYVVLDRDLEEIKHKTELLAKLYPKASTINYIYSETSVDRFPKIKLKLDIASYLEDISNHGPKVIGPDSLDYYTNILKKIKSDVGNNKFVHCSIDKYDYLFNTVAVDLYLLYGLIPLSTSIRQLCDNLISRTYDSNLPVYNIKKQLDNLPRLLTSYDKRVNYLAVIKSYSLSMNVSAIPVSDLGKGDIPVSSITIDTRKGVEIKDIFSLYGIDGGNMYNDMEGAESLKDAFRALKSRLTNIETSIIYSVFNVVAFAVNGIDYIGFLYRDSLKLEMDTLIKVPGLGDSEMKLGFDNLKELVPMDFNYRTLKTYMEFKRALGISNGRPLYNIRYPYIYASATWDSKPWEYIPSANYLSLCLYDTASVQSRGRDNKLLFDAIGDEKFFEICDIFGGFSPVKKGDVIL